MKLFELDKLYDFSLIDVDCMVLEQEHHLNRIRYLPKDSVLLTYHPEQQFNEIMCPDLYIELKNGNVIEAKISI